MGKCIIVEPHLTEEENERNLEVVKEICKNIAIRHKEKLIKDKEA